MRKDDGFRVKEKKITLKEDVILTGPFWNEPVRVLKLNSIGNGFLELYCEGLETGRLHKNILSNSELDTLKIEAYDATFDKFSCDPELFFLGIESYRIRLAYEFDPHFAVNISQIDPLPHQIKAVYGQIMGKPRIRYMIADDPGAGKTIMAGLVFKELKYRGVARRVLIVVPGHLKYQWQREMKEKFRENFDLIDRNIMQASWARNIWDEKDQCITSMDFAKQEDVRESLQEAMDWDLVIVDEAHKMAAYKSGRKIYKTLRYKLGEVLSKKSLHLLFLTATPHKGDPENFRLLLNLLDPDLFANKYLLEESIRRGENPLFIRRLKEDLRDFEGRPLFPPRYVHTVKYRLSSEEKTLYEQVSRYVMRYYRKAVLRKNRNVALALLILQRRLASSVRAVRRSLERRRAKLEAMLKEGEIPLETGPIISLEGLEDLPESEKWEYEAKLEKLTLARDLDELQDEVEELQKLVELARSVERMEVETKLRQLKNVMEELGLPERKEIKLIVFTEARDTMEYLAEKLRDWGYDVVCIHGGMNLDERIRAEREFRHRTQVLVATEAAGEGINLQFCWLMVNYDIPWNPNRLEQRMGRIHRYGQRHEVHIYNLVAIDTREGRILEKLFEKLRIMRQHLGSDRVFDIIGEIFEEVNLEELIKLALARERTIDEILEMFDAIPDEKLIEKARQITAKSLAVKHMDLSKLREDIELAEQSRLVPEYIERFFLKGFRRYGGSIELRKDGFYRIPRVPVELRRISSSIGFRNQFGLVDRGYPKISFSKEQAFKDEQAEFVAPGHPLLESLIEMVLKEFQKTSIKSAVFLDPGNNLKGLIWFLKGEVIDGFGFTVGRRIFALFQSEDGKITQIPPSILWDLKPVGNTALLEDLSKLLFEREKILQFSIESLLQKYKQELRQRREKEVEIKRKYGLRSLDLLIKESTRKIRKFQQEKMLGKDMELAITNEKLRREQLLRRREELLEKIKAERNLTLKPPEIIGIVAVLPLEDRPAEEAAEDREIERLGMKIVIEFERQQGRKPLDVSSQNLGFDIRSESPNELRYIEVKARARSGYVTLTPNEWIAAQRFREKYWLYIVTDVASCPKLHLIQDPAATLEPREEMKIVRYVIPEEQWQKKAQVING